MTDSVIIFWWLKALLLLVSIVSGYLITYKYDSENGGYWKYSLPMIVAYGLIEGLRYMRGVDYFSYLQNFEYGTMALTDAGERDSVDFVFDLYCSFIHYSGLPSWYGFLILSFFLIFSLSFLIKRIPHCAIWAFPLFVILCATEAENIVRQYMSISFIMLSFSFYLEEKKRLALLLLACALLCHFSSIIVIFVFLLFGVVLNRETLYQRSPLFLILVYIGLFYFWDNSYFSFITDFVKAISPQEDMAGASYLQNADRWFTEQGSMSFNRGSQAVNLGFLYKLFVLIPNCLTLWFGWYAINNDCQVKQRIIFWGAYLAMIFAAIGGDIEIYMRFQYWFLFCVPLLVGIGFKVIPKSYLWGVMPFYLIRYGYYMFLGLWGAEGISGCLFIWDK